MPLRTAAGRPIVAAPVPTPLPKVTLTYIGREQDDWCWAAVGEMVLTHRGRFSGKQCEFAMFLFSSTCCASPSSTNCDRGCKVADVLRVYSNWSHSTSVYRSGIIDYGANPLLPSLEEELKLGRAVEVAWYLGGGKGHILLVYGLQRTGAVDEVLVYDPDPTIGPTTMSYDNLKDARGAGSWDHTWIKL